ncbi:peptidylprolyl isomerase [Alicyclobacillus sp. SO9]|nr:peptidylprolyl isomerase [Alicyclobacillus sp. SO9]QQE81346.1 peptidylprolyl isomerase [Alicyclobacillus sp. SO9]
MKLEQGLTYQAVIHTNKGDLTVDLFSEDAPITVNNFVFLAQDGYFDDVIFHRIIKGFMVQTGDPMGTGMGGPGYQFQDELPPVVPYEPGVVAMANAGPNTNGSQFFICSGEHSKNLNQQPNYTVFGKVSKGMDVVQKLENTPVGRSSMGEMSKPEETVKINSVEILKAPK